MVECTSKSRRHPKGGGKDCPLHRDRYARESKTNDASRPSLEDFRKGLRDREAERQIEVSEIINSGKPITEAEIETLFNIGLTEKEELDYGYDDLWDSKVLVTWRDLEDGISEESLPAVVAETEELGPITLHYSNFVPSNYESFHIIFSYIDPIRGETFLKKAGAHGSYGRAIQLQSNPPVFVKPRQVPKIVYETKWDDEN